MNDYITAPPPSPIQAQHGMGVGWGGGGTLCGHPQLIESMGICVLRLAHNELRGCDVYLHIVKDLS